jgi:putative copper export protein
VLVAIFWFGSLLPLLIVVRKESSRYASAAIASFTRVATVAVPFIFFAGVTLMLLIIPGWSVFGRPYGKLLAFKISGFGALVILASLNKWRYGPALAQGGTVAERFPQSVMIEFLIMSTVLAATALMTALYSPFPD